MNVEQKQREPKIQKSDLAYQVVGKYFGAKNDAEAYKIWQKTVKDNKDWLARMAGVTTHTGTAEQNIKIAERLRKNDVEPFYGYKENAAKIKDFGKIQEIYHSKNLSDLKTFQYYIANLDNAQIATLNALSLEQRAFFIIEQCQNVDKTQGSIQNRVEDGGNIENKNLAAMKELMDMQEKIENFIQKYSSEIPMISRFKRKESEKNGREGFVDEEIEKEFQSFYKEQKSTEEYKKIVEKYGDMLAEEQYRQLFIVKNIDMSALSEEAKREFADIVVGVCEQAKKFGVDVVKMGFDIMYYEALNIYQSTDMYTQLSSKVFSDPDFNAHFDKPENKVDQLVPDNQKDVVYYKYLIKLYPDIDTKNIMKMFTEEYFTLRPAMHIKNSAPEEVKEIWEQFLIVVDKKDEKLLERTNAIIQHSAIEQCLIALQKTMDIDIDEGKNVLEKIQLDGDLDAIEEQGSKLLLNLKGNVNGKKIDISYDLISGKVYYKKYMQKKGMADNAPIMIGSSEIKDDSIVPFIQLPTLGSVIKKGKAMANNGGYVEVMEKSEDSKMYEKNLQDICKNEYTITENIDHELGKDMIKKNILEDGIVQKMLKIGGRDFSTGIITDTQYPSTHKLYNYIYNSFECYSLKPMFQLKNWNDCMDKILAIKDTNIAPQEVINQEEKNNKNQERLVLNGLVNQKIMGKENPEMKNQVVETNLLSFFQCFETKIGGMNIVDVEMMKDYFTLVKKNTNQGELGKWKRNSNTKFTSLYADFQGLLSVNEIENKLMDQYDNNSFV